MTAEEYIKDKLKEYETAEQDGSMYLFRYKELKKYLNEFAELQTQPLKQEIEKLQKLLYMIEKANEEENE